MKVIHFCISCFYIDGFTYQENMLVRAHVNQGHDVLVVASTETYNKEGKLDYCQPGDYIGSDGAKVIRLPYSGLFPHFLQTKLRCHKGVKNILLNFRPDVIVFHGATGWELLTVRNYVKHNSSVKLYVDSHEDFNNSARSFVSRFFLYRLYYSLLVKLSRKYVCKFLYITYETKIFCKEMYGLNDKELEYFPLGGLVFDDEEYNRKRKFYREKLGIKSHDSTVLFVQTGKFDEKKKLVNSLRAFSKLVSNNSKFIIAGNFDSSIRNECMDLIESDPRIEYIGWIGSDELTDLLCAADVYVQPGSQSATLQMSIASRCAFIAADVPSHRDILYGNGFLTSTDDDIFQAINAFGKDEKLILDMQVRSYEFAKTKLDYSQLAGRLLK